MDTIPDNIATQLNAKVAQLVEHYLAKVRVASSNLVFRSISEYSTVVSALVFQTGNDSSSLSIRSKIKFLTF